MNRSESMAEVVRQINAAEEAISACEQALRAVRMTMYELSRDLWVLSAEDERREKARAKRAAPE